MNIHLQVIEKNGRKEFVVIPYDEFLRIHKELHDLEDIRILSEEQSTAATYQPNP